MKYKSIMEILESEELSLTEMQEEMEQYIRSKGMTSEEFMTTEEGQRIQEMSDKARFCSLATPTISQTKSNMMQMEPPQFT